MASTQQSVLHPLDPLTEEELRAAVALFREHAGLSETARFAMLVLHEPPKTQVMAWDGVRQLDRQALAIVLEKADGGIWEGVCSLTRGEVRSWERVRPGQGQPPVLYSEIMELDEIVKADPRWRQAVLKRGDIDVDLVQLDPFSAGQFGFEDEQGRRIVRALAFARHHMSDNAYAHPIENVIAHVDLNAREVVKVVDGEVVPIPPECGNYGAQAPEIQPRRDLKPLNVEQPEGVSFEVDGHEVSWQRWSLRVSLTPREGLVLHQITYDGRPILYRASIAEMVVPYGDPSPAHFWRSAFDAGEFGLGTLTDSLELGCDCLGVIHYFDAWLAGDDGEPVKIPNAVCLHEEDYSILWKHSDFRYGMRDVRRSRRLVLSHFANVGNYDYGFYWYFYLDGSIQHEVKLNGIVQTSAAEAGKDGFAPLIAPGLTAPIHQHLFCARLDFDLDGTANSVVEVHAEGVPDRAQNEHGTVFRAVETPLRRESEAQRLADPLRARYWKVFNAGSRNRLDQPVAYKLVPHPAAPLLAQPGTSLARRAAFATKHLWVTAYDPRERFAAGDYPNQHEGDAGLPAYVAQDRPLENTDVVLWHTFGPTHVVRPEDWPIMPVEYAGFWLKPVGFFDRNPSLDVPELPTTSTQCHHDGHCH
jgi:primary-amine oxidase